MSSAHTATDPTSRLARVMLVGASGRMGRAITRCLAAQTTSVSGKPSDQARLALGACVVRDESPLVGQPVEHHPSLRYVGAARALHDALAASVTAMASHVGAKSTPENAHRPLIICDFSTPSGVAAMARAVAQAAATDRPLAHAGVIAPRTALVVGVTGLDGVVTAQLRELAHACPVLLTPNTSLGVAAFAHAAASITRALGPGYSFAITETHHERKKDAPSGTAIRLADAIRGAGGAITNSQIESIRAGEVVGTHTITIQGPAEVIELTHRATTRDLFALGALRCMAFLAGKPPGWYTMDDVVRG